MLYMNDITNLVTKLENEYTQGKTTISKYVDYSMFDDLQKIDAYANSKHISGDTDSQGREKPFFNIVTSAINIWYRATDIDRRNIKFRATKAKHWIATFLANIILQEWMRKENFGKFLNQWGYILAKYGSAVTKWVEKDGKLHSRVVDWNKLIVDPVDFYSNPVIEVLELTPAQLRENKSYDQEIVEQLIETATTRETLDGQTKDNRSDYIKLYEVHGELPKSYLTGKEEDSDKYQQQMHVISLVSQEGEDDESFTLYSGAEEKNPYFLTHLIEEDGKTLATGAVKSLFEAQWMVNHNAKAIKDQLDVASKLLYQTSDVNFTGQNVIDAIQNGQIMIHKVNEPLTQINNRADIAPMQTQLQAWQQNGVSQAGISEAMQGASPKSGTAWRQTEAILQESHSLFELMTENKGLCLEDMMREFVIPHIKTKLDNSEEISAILQAHDIEKIDKLYVEAEVYKVAQEEVKNALLQGNMPVEFDPMAIQEDIEEDLRELGTQRFFKPSEISDKTWAEIFDDFEWEVEVDVTGEASDAQRHLTTLTTLYQNLIQTGSIETAQKVMNKILEITGAFSPVEMTEIEATPMPTVADEVGEMALPEAQQVS